MESGQITVTKIEAAERQLVTAIQLFFDDKDAISVHTLTRAAHELLERICVSRGLKGGVIRQGLESVKPQHRDMVLDKVNEAKNFFKHGNSLDSEDKISWNPEVSQYFIWDATSLYRDLDIGIGPCEIVAFSLWFRMKHSELWIGQVSHKDFNDKIDSLTIDLKNHDKKYIYDFFLRHCKLGQVFSKPK